MDQLFDAVCNLPHQLLVESACLAFPGSWGVLQDVLGPSGIDLGRALAHQHLRSTKVDLLEPTLEPTPTEQLR